jgi:hypothetical protein
MTWAELAKSTLLYLVVVLFALLALRGFIEGVLMP